MALRIDVDRTSALGLRDQIHSEISRHILERVLGPGSRLPSCRRLACELGVSINTVLGAYTRLQADNLIESRERSGYFVRADVDPPHHVAAAAHDDKDGRRVRMKDYISVSRLPSRCRQIMRPENWRDYPYPFVCNQIDVGRFPLAEWRECTRLAMNRRELGIWSGDNHYQDSGELLNQICNRILIRRGIFARPENLLITMGTQQALYIVATLFGGADRTIAIEDPGYPDARSMFRQMFGCVRFIPVDRHGMLVDSRLEGIDMLYVTPNRQFPTSVSMTQSRRAALLQMAEQEDFLIIEDDYECAVDFREALHLALHRQDVHDRVIYVGSLSKSLAPGLRLGFLVAPSELIDEARAVRGMMVRHTPLILQHTAALFLRFGHYDALLSRLHTAYRDRWHIADALLRREFSDHHVSGESGGTSFMLSDLADRRHASAVTAKALEKGVVIESVAPCFSKPAEGRNAFRIGVSSLAGHRIEPGLAILREILDSH